MRRLGYVGPAFQEAFAGVSPTVFSKGYSCGRCVRLQCTDQICDNLGQEIILLITG